MCATDGDRRNWATLRKPTCSHPFAPPHRLPPQTRYKFYSSLPTHFNCLPCRNSDCPTSLLPAIPPCSAQHGPALVQLRPAPRRHLSYWFLFSEQPLPDVFRHGQEPGVVDPFPVSPTYRWHSEHGP